MAPKCTAPSAAGPGPARSARGAGPGHHPLVDRDVAPRHLGHRPLRGVGEGGVEGGRRAPPRARAPRRRRPSPARRASAPTSPGGTSTPWPPTTRAYPGRSLATTAARRRHGLEQHHAEGLAPQRRCAQTRARRPGATPTRRRRSGPTTRGGRSGDGGAAAISVSGPSPATHTVKLRQPGSSRARAASSRTPRPLRSSWRPTNTTVGPDVGHGRAVDEALEVDAVADDLVVAAEGVARRGLAPRPTPRSAPPVGRPWRGPAGRAAGRRCSARHGGTSPPWAARTPPDRRSRARAPKARAGAARRIRPCRTARTARTVAPGPSATGATDPLARSRPRSDPADTKAPGARPWTTTSPSQGASTTASWPARGEGGGQARRT